jgi:hypothetical protein
LTPLTPHPSPSSDVPPPHHAAGTRAGDSLLSYASTHHIPIVWALGDATDGSSHHSFSGPASAYNQRLLSPAAVADAHLNTTLPDDATATFNHLWQRAKLARLLGQPSTETVKGWWAELQPVSVQMQPVGATSCADVDECIGVAVASGECVCMRGHHDGMVEEAA